MKRKYCNAELEEITVKELQIAYCCKEWQVNEDSLRPNVKNSYWAKSKGSN